MFWLLYILYNQSEVPPAETKKQAQSGIEMSVSDADIYGMYMVLLIHDGALLHWSKP